jgi:hypothetical protein
MWSGDFRVGDTMRERYRLRRSTRPPNKGMKQTKPEHNGASQLIWSDRCQVPEIRWLP